MSERDARTPEQTFNAERKYTEQTDGCNNFQYIRRHDAFLHAVAALGITSFVSSVCQFAASICLFDHWYPPAYSPGALDATRLRVREREQATEQANVSGRPIDEIASQRLDIVSVEPDQTEGEDGTRSPSSSWGLMALTVLCPSLGYMSVGRLGSGLVANALVVAFETVLLVATAYWQVFPGTTLVFAVLAWLVLTVMMGTEVILEARRADSATVESYHWTTNLAVGLLTFALPLALLVGVAGTNLYSVVTVQSDAMYPTLRPGDRVLVTRSFAAPEPLHRGRVVTVRTQKHGVRILRVAALPGQQFSMAGRRISVSTEDVPAIQVDRTFVADQLEGLGANGNFEFWVEEIGDHRYIVSYSALGSAGLLVPPVKLRKQQWFGLADNRSQRRIDGKSAPIVDSRQVGPFEVEQILGRPAFIAWSVKSDAGTIDWKRTWARMGLRLQ